MVINYPFLALVNNRLYPRSSHNSITLYITGTYELDGKEAYQAVRWALEVISSTWLPRVLILTVYQAGYRLIVRILFIPLDHVKNFIDTLA